MGEKVFGKPAKSVVLGNFFWGGGEFAVAYIAFSKKMSSLVFLSFSLVFIYSCVSQEGFSGGWTGSLRVEEFSCVFEIMIIACPSIHYFFLTLPWLQQNPGVSLLPFPCWCSLLQFFFLFYTVGSSQSMFNSVNPICICSSPSLSFWHFTVFLLSIALLLVSHPLCSMNSGVRIVHRIVQTASHLPRTFPADPPQRFPPPLPGGSSQHQQFHAMPHIKLHVKKRPVSAKGWHVNEHCRWGSAHFML